MFSLAAVVFDTKTLLEANDTTLGLQEVTPTCSFLIEIGSFVGSIFVVAAGICGVAAL